MATPLILCVASYFKGARFLTECRRLGCQVFLLTKDSLAGRPWPREALDDVFLMPEFTRREDVVKAVSYLARTREIDRIVPLDDYDVDLVASLREHLRIPGMGDTTARYFRDKLAMRVQARDAGIPCPRFEHVLNHARLHRFMEEVPGPWILKPRSEAGAVGIKKIHAPHELWEWVERMGDEQSHKLLEEFVAGPVFHVDSIVWDREVQFSVAHQYLKPPFDIWNHGGIFGTRTLPPASPGEPDLQDMNRRVIQAMGLVRGVTHAEFIRSEKDGQLHFLEIAARVGGAHIDDLVEASTGVNLWEEWARLEIASLKGEGYSVPAHRRDCAGLLICLARHEHPDLSAYSDPEVVWRMSHESHAGLILNSPDCGRIEWLLGQYAERFGHDFLAVQPPTDTPLA